MDKLTQENAEEGLSRISSLITLGWVYSANKGNPLESMKEVQRNLNKFYCPLC